MPGETSLNTASMAFRKVRKVNAATNATFAKVPTTTAPFTETSSGTQQLDAGTAAGSAVIALGGKGGGHGQNGAVFVPYGLGAANDAFSMRVYGWRVIQAPGVLDLWVPVNLLEVTCTVGSATGVAGSAVLNTELFVDTIAIVATSGNDDVSVDIVSPADNTIAHFVMDLKGFQFIECGFDDTTNTPTMNALVALI